MNSLGQLNTFMRPNEPMTPQVIQHMLDSQAPDGFRTPQQRLAWQRGYLTGLLAQLANENVMVHLAIRQRLGS